jgi:cyclohexanecarboxylate-CoA ligase
MDDRAFEQWTLWQLVEWRAEQTPDALFAVDEDGRRLTFAEYRDRCLAVAAALAADGVGPETRVAWMLPTWLEAFVLAGALARLGACQVPMIPILRHKEVGFILRQTDARHLVVPGVWRGVDYPAMAREVVAGLDHDVSVRVVDASTRALPTGDPSALPPAPVAERDALRWVFYTSGTTADPKGTRHSDRTVAACALRMNRRFDAVPDDRNALVFPVTHIGGIAFLMGGLMAGFAHICISVFEPESSCALMSREGVTMAGAGPVFWMTYVDQQRRHPERRLFPALRALLGGGAPKPPTIHDEVRDVLGVVLATGYGSSECPTVSHGSVHDSDEVLRRDGRLLDDTEVRIVRLDGTPAALGEDGEIRVKAPMLFLGYLDPSADADAFDDEGYHRTGDIGRIDGHGVLTITGRLKDIVIRKGENISAKEVEDVLYQHPAVADAAVIALPDRERGELACAVIVVTSGHEAPTLDDLAQHCRSLGLSARKVPERLEVVDVLPRNPTGKVLKFELQARYR